MIIISVADFLMFNFSMDPGADPRHIDSKTCFKKFQQNYTSFFKSLTKLRVFMFQSGFRKFCKNKSCDLDPN